MGCDWHREDTTVPGASRSDGPHAEGEVMIIRTDELPASDRPRAAAGAWLRWRRRRELTMSTFDDLDEPTGSEDQALLGSSRDRFYAGGAAGATALVVDDNSRDTFALTALLE